MHPAGCGCDGCFRQAVLTLLADIRDDYRFTHRATSGRMTLNEKETMMAQQIPDTQAPFKARILGFADAMGNPAKVDGAPTWEVSDPALGSVVADDATGMVATVTITGKLGTLQVRATADADLGAGVTPLVLVGDLEIIAGAAIAGALAFDLGVAP